MSRSKFIFIVLFAVLFLQAQRIPAFSWGSQQSSTSQTMPTNGSSSSNSISRTISREGINLPVVGKFFADDRDLFAINAEARDIGIDIETRIFDLKSISTRLNDMDTTTEEYNQFGPNFDLTTTNILKADDSALISNPEESALDLKNAALEILLERTVKLEEQRSASGSANFVLFNSNPVESTVSTLVSAQEHTQDISFKQKLTDGITSLIERRGEEALLTEAKNSKIDISLRMLDLETVSSRLDNFNPVNEGQKDIKVRVTLDLEETATQILTTQDASLKSEEKDDPVDLKNVAFDILVKNIRTDDEIIESGEAVAYYAAHSIATTINTLASASECTQDSVLQEKLSSAVKTVYNDSTDYGMTGKTIDKTKLTPVYGYRARSVLSSELSQNLNQQARDIIGESELTQPAINLGLFYTYSNSAGGSFKRPIATAIGVDDNTMRGKITEIVNSPYGSLTLTQRETWAGLLPSDTGDPQTSFNEHFYYDYMNIGQFVSEAKTAATQGDNSKLKIIDFMTNAFSTDDGKALVINWGGYSTGGEEGTMHAYELYQAPVKEENFTINGEQETYSLPDITGVTVRWAGFVPMD